MPVRTPVLIVAPGDDPPQIQGSPQLERLRAYGEVIVHTDRPQSLEEKIARAKDAVCLMNTRSAVKWPAEALRALPRLRMATACGIGTDAFDLKVARELGITVCNIPGRTAPIVAEHAFGLMLALAKRAYFQTAELKAGRWIGGDNVYLNGKVLGIVGTGNIGARMARLAHAIGMEVLAWTFDPSPSRAAELGVRFVPLDDLLKQSDVVSLHVKLTDRSRGLIGARELALMKPGAMLVNTARGAVVDTLSVGRGAPFATPRRRRTRCVRHRAAARELSVACMRASYSDCSQRRSNPGGHGPPECRRRGQRNRLPGGTTTECGDLKA